MIEYAFQIGGLHLERVEHLDDLRIMERPEYTSVLANANNMCVYIYIYIYRYPTLSLSTRSIVSIVKYYTTLDITHVRGGRVLLTEMLPPRTAGQEDVCPIAIGRYCLYDIYIYIYIYI